MRVRGLSLPLTVLWLRSRAEIEGEMGDHHIALQARLMGQALRKLTASVSRTGATLLFINQLRSKVFFLTLGLT